MTVRLTINLILTIAVLLGQQASAPAAWGDKVNLSHSSARSRAPDVVATESGAVFSVWEEGDFLYYSRWDGNSWSTPAFVATGESPALAVGPQEGVHLVWSNEFGGNFEIYYSRWTGERWDWPRNVSSTSGVSLAPDIAVAPDGLIHVVWTDNTPGFPIVYHAWSSDGIVWSNFPVPSGDGEAPRIAVHSDGSVHLVWQDLDGGGYYDVLYSWWDGQEWSLPQNISDSYGDDSTLASIAVGGNGKVHLAWEETTQGPADVYYSGGEGFNWSLSENVSQTPGNSYLPSTAVDTWGNVRVVWDEGDEILSRVREADQGDWLMAEQVAVNSDGVSEPELSIAAGTPHAVWAEQIAPGDWDVFYSSRVFEGAYGLYLPIIVNK